MRMLTCLGLMWVMLAQPCAGAPQISIDQVRRDLRPLDFTTNEAPTEAIRDYVAYYGLDIPDAGYRIGSFASGTNTLAAQIFTPGQPRGTVLLLHGYYDHAGIWKNAIRFLVTNGFTVAVFDQPGHGLSTGARASIGDFNEYTTALDRFVTICTNNLPAPYHLVAHSMGCSASIDYLLMNTNDPLDRVVFLAPLVRSVAWKISSFGQKLAGSRIASVPRKFRANSSDREFLKFYKKDPLQARSVPMSWASAHRAWIERLAGAGTSAKPIRIIQGTRDTTVAWKYNLERLQKVFPRAEIIKIEKGGHHLINESPAMRAEVLRLLLKELQTGEAL